MQHPGDKTKQPLFIDRCETITADDKGLILNCRDKKYLLEKEVVKMIKNYDTN